MEHTRRFAGVNQKHLRQAAEETDLPWSEIHNETPGTKTTWTIVFRPDYPLIEKFEVNKLSLKQAIELLEAERQGKAR